MYGFNNKFLREFLYDPDTPILILYLLIKYAEEEVFKKICMLLNIDIVNDIPFNNLYGYRIIKILIDNSEQNDKSYKIILRFLKLLCEVIIKYDFFFNITDIKKHVYYISYLIYAIAKTKKILYWEQDKSNNINLYYYNISNLIDKNVEEPIRKNKIIVQTKFGIYVKDKYNHKIKVRENIRHIRMQPKFNKFLTTYITLASRKCS